LVMCLLSLVSIIVLYCIVYQDTLSLWGEFLVVVEYTGGGDSSIPQVNFFGIGIPLLFYKLYLYLISSSGIPPNCMERFVAAFTAPIVAARSPLCSFSGIEH